MMKNNMLDTITATELVRNLSVTLDHVWVTRNHIAITKGAKTVAELGPPPKQGLPIYKLADLLQSLPKPQEERAWLQESYKEIEIQANLPENPWA